MSHFRVPLGYHFKMTSGEGGTKIVTHSDKRPYKSDVTARIKRNVAKLCLNYVYIYLNVDKYGLIWLNVAKYG